MRLRAAESARKARAMPGTYVLFGRYPQSLANRVVARVKAGGYPAFADGMWDATRRQDEVWVMYLGSRLP
ncbi:hypothetical protein J4032_28195 [Streptomyces formicae]|uniref:Uncharacterized protein n=2 Tax=Streptomyces formicae TaxID=1616117 RepID=A0ABY3WTM6_9ACTN|nr:hypothetical protein [Streptomyces formicae]UNM14829.1 hypothetical protein J4032_28195 [Streptomyces formicae]